MINKYFLVKANATMNVGDEEKEVVITMDELGISFHGFGFDSKELVDRNLSSNGIKLGEDRYAVLYNDELVNIKVKEIETVPLISIIEEPFRYKKTIGHYYNTHKDNISSLLSLYEDMKVAENLVGVPQQSDIDRYIRHINTLAPLEIVIEEKTEQRYLKRWACIKEFKVRAEIDIIAETEEQAEEILDDIELNEYNLDFYGCRDVVEREFDVEFIDCYVDDLIDEEYELIEE